MRKHQQNEQSQFIQEWGKLLANRLGQPPAPVKQNDEPLGQFVRVARDFHGISHARLAQLTGKREVDIHAIEQGIFPLEKIEQAFIYRLAVALDEDVDTLLLLCGLPKPTKKPRSLWWRTWPQHRLNTSKNHPDKQAHNGRSHWTLTDVTTISARFGGQFLQTIYTFPTRGLEQTVRLQPLLATFIVILFLSYSAVVFSQIRGVPEVQSSTIANVETATTSYPSVGYTKRTPQYELQIHNQNVIGNGGVFIPVSDDAVAMIVPRKAVPNSRIVEPCDKRYGPIDNLCPT